MRALAVAIVLFVASPAVLATATAPNPRLEKVALRAPDMRYASGATVKLSDLAGAWKGGAVDPGSAAPDCVSQNFSSFTLTGRAEADFQDGAALLVSVANLFPTAGQSLGDFRVGTRAGTVGCEGQAFRKALGKATTLVSARQVAAPSVGERAAAFRFVLKHGELIFYSDVIEFVRGRALAAVISVSPGRPLAGAKALARVMDERLQAGTA